MNQINAYIILLAALVFAGCGGPAYEYDAVVNGTVTIDGQLAKSGTVTFHPVSGGKIAIGRINERGSYSLRTGQGDLREVDGGTVVPGAYIVTVSITGPPVPSVIEGAPPSAGPSLVASKYALLDTSDLKLTVKSGEQVINLELEPAEPTPPTQQLSELEVQGSAEETTPDEDAQPDTEAQTDAPMSEEPTETDPAEVAPAAQPSTAEPAADQSVEPT